MRDYELETKRRVEFIRGALESARAGGIVFANSGGKDCALTGILCKMACDNTVGLILPCVSKRNYESDKTDAEAVAGQFNIEKRLIDLTAARNELVRVFGGEAALNNAAITNIAPRLRMISLYAVAANENRLVAGTGNRSERFMGYFTKWGDGAFDFNPIADLTVTEVYEFLRFLKASDSIIAKVPSAGLYEGQTDEGDLGISYNSIDKFLLSGDANGHDRAILERYHNSSGHKRRMPLVYGADENEGQP